MGFLSSLVKGATGWLTGGPIGAALGLLSPGDDSQPQAQQRVIQNPLGNDEGQQISPEAIAFLRGYLDGGQPKPTTFNAERAMQGPAPMQQTTAQTGGMSSHSRNGNFYQLGAGKGAGGTSGGSTDNDYWRNSIASVLRNYGNAYTGQSAPAFNTYLTRALSGQDTLPQAAQQRAFSQGMNTINAQTQNARQGLMANLGSRGLMQSGMMGRGLTGIEQQRLGSIGQLSTGLADQQLQAQREAQRAALGIYPQLIGVQSNAMGDWARVLLGLRSSESQAGQLGLNAQMAGDAADQAKWNMLAGLAGGISNWYFGNKNNASKDTDFIS